MKSHHLPASRASARFFVAALCGVLAWFAGTPARAGQAVTLAPGASATLSVTADGTAPFTYQWRKDGVSLAGATGDRYQIVGASSVHAGVYTVVVANAAGSTVSDSAMIALEAAVAPLVTAQPLSRTVYAGDPISFEAAVSGTAPIAYRWHRNGVAPSDGGALSGVSTAKLLIAGAVAMDAGTYTLVATNAAGTVTSAGASLTVLARPVAPSITQQPVSLSVTEGATATFTVTASGEPAPSYRWRKDGVALSDGGRYSGATTRSLTVANATGAEAGVYTVVATNTSGSATSAGATLSVTAPTSAPVVVQQPVSQAVLEGATVALSVQASGNPAPTYRWLKDGLVLSDGGIVSGAATATLTLHGVTTADAGLYTAIATNSAGSATSSAAALAVSAPVAPEPEPEPEPVPSVPTLAELDPYNTFVPPAFDVAGYLARNPKYRNRFKNNPLGAWLHYRDKGVLLGELYDNQFRPEEYLVLHPELLEAYGPNLRAALLHWVNLGWAEGRQGRF